MRNHSCFQTPYHYFDVIRQVSEVFHANRKAAEEVDLILMGALREYGAMFGHGVEARSTIPGIVLSAPDPNLVLMFDAENETQAAEVRRLHSELLSARSWDEEEWTKTTNELQATHEQIPLDAIQGTLLWLLSDFGRVKATYRWLAMEN